MKTPTARAAPSIHVDTLVKSGSILGPNWILKSEMQLKLSPLRHGALLELIEFMLRVCLIALCYSKELAGGAFLSARTNTSESSPETKYKTRRAQTS
jgi:hypothetical protein